MPLAFQSFEVCPCYKEQKELNACVHFHLIMVCVCVCVCVCGGGGGRGGQNVYFLLDNI